MITDLEPYEHLLLNDEQVKGLEFVHNGLHTLLTMARRKHRWISQMNNGVCNLIELTAAEAYWQAHVDGEQRKKKLRQIRGVLLDLYIPGESIFSGTNTKL